MQPDLCTDQALPALMLVLGQNLHSAGWHIPPGRCTAVMYMLAVFASSIAVCNQAMPASLHSLAAGMVRSL